MTVQKIIEEMEKELMAQIVEGDMDYKDANILIHSYTRKLIEAVAEEIIPGKRGGMAESLSMEAYVNGFNDAVSYMSLKVKEIINSLEK